MSNVTYTYRVVPSIHNAHNYCVSLSNFHAKRGRKPTKHAPVRTGLTLREAQVLMVKLTALLPT